MIETERILQGLARTLEESVLPALDGGFARGQLYAVLDVLSGLEGQVAWGGMMLENEAMSLASLMEEAAGTAGGALGERLRAYATMSSAPLADRLREGRALLCALIEEGCADDGDLKVAVDSFLTNDTLFKAMALRPSRLAEISQG